MHSDHVGFIPRMKGRCDIQDIINGTYNLNSSKKENHMIISLMQKAFDKIIIH